MKKIKKSIPLWFQYVYWKLYYFLRNIYFIKKYSNKVPKIYYDKKYNCYINPQKINEYGCCEYVCSELVQQGVHYSYYLSERRYHVHTINEVFLLITRLKLNIAHRN